MATLVSPGVEVPIIDESFYGSSGPGTVPLIVFATAANKASPSGTGVAPYSVPNQAGKMFLATSQRELVQNYGVPSFKSIQGTPIHGHELNEYGLLSAYQYLGVSNRAFVMRADIDLDQLEASAASPAGLPVPGQHWFDLNETRFGVFQSNGKPFAGDAWAPQPSRAVAILGEDVHTLEITPADFNNSGYVFPYSAYGVTKNEFIPDDPKNPTVYLRDVPKGGATGEFAIVTTMSDNYIFEKLGNQWVKVGSDAWKAANPTLVIGTIANPTVLPTDAIEINGEVVTFDESAGQPTTSPVDLATVVAIIAEKAAASTAGLATVEASAVNNRLQLKNATGGDLTIAVSGSTDTPAKLGLVSARGVRVYRTNDAQYPENSVAGDVWIKGTTPNRGADWVVKVWDADRRWVKMTAPMYPYSSNLCDRVGPTINGECPSTGEYNHAKDEKATAAFGIPAVGQIYVGYDDTNGSQQLRRWNGRGWENLSYDAGTVAPTMMPEAGTLWYNADLKADIMVGNGRQWEGYLQKYPLTDPNGVIISGSTPKEQSDGTPLVDNDLWIDSSDEENYPMLYRYNESTRRWKAVDKADQTTPFGIVFADARDFAAPSSDYVDPDAPSPYAYPNGVLLFNTRYSTGNVKEWKPNHFALGGYDDNIDYSEVSYKVGDKTFNKLNDVGRWVTASGNQADGSPYMLRKAQRIMVVRSMAAMIVANEDLRSELVYYNLIAAPGYPELMDELVTLNTDKKEVAFIVGDTPCRLPPIGTAINNWATNALNAPSTGETGLTLSNPYVGLYYPWGLSTNLDGMEVMVPPSTIVLRTMAYNDLVAYPWYAPAGYRRGLVTNATSVGYLTSENEFKPVLLSPGQRDVLYTNKINPIAFIPNRGLVVYGQKTLNPLSTALDRVNVARLTNYLKYNLDNLVKPFLFEQNDIQTRDSARVTVERFLNGLVGLSALEDYAVVCDTSNNTPERRERNELWIDIAIKPVHSIEFIYVPVRILNLGDSMPQTTIPT